MYENSLTVSAEHIARRKATRKARQKRIRNRRIFFTTICLVAAILLVLILTAFASNENDTADGMCCKCNYNQDQVVFTHEVTVNSDSEKETPAVITNVSFNADTLANEKKIYTEQDVELIAKTVYGEALVTQSDTEMAAVVWCILNRVDANDFACGNSIEYVVTSPKQFHGYDADNPVTPHIKELVIDVLDRWQAEKEGVEDVGRILPKEYRYFEGDGKHNHYITEYGGKDYWDWSLESPYES